MPSTRVDGNTVQITKSTIFFQFNCSWFSDINGAVKFFTIVVTESDGWEHFFSALCRDPLVSLHNQTNVIIPFFGQIPTAKISSLTNIILFPRTWTTGPTALSKRIRPVTSAATVTRARAQLRSSRFIWDQAWRVLEDGVIRKNLWLMQRRISPTSAMGH